MANASKSASAANQIQRINPYQFHSVRHFMFNGSAERFTGDMKIVYSHLANLHNRFGNILISFKKLDEQFGLGTELFNTTRFITQKFIQMGILSKYEEDSRIFYRMNNVELDLV